MTGDTPSERPGLERHSALLPLYPLLHVVWADGILSPTELAAFRTHVDGQDWLEPDTREVLRRWLDPYDPPSPDELSALLEAMRTPELEDPESAVRSLTDLGLALRRRDRGTEIPADPDFREGLRSLEDALGVVGREAARRVLGLSAPEVVRGTRAPAFQAGALQDYLDAHQGEVRRRVMELLERKVLHVPLETPREEYRERVLKAVRFLADEGIGALAFPEEHGGSGDPGAAIAAFETLAFGDLSVLVKYGVQFGLFGGSVYQLGTEEHHRRWLPDIATLELPGCYAMTETGHGSNVRELETTATYDPDTDELVVNTPTEDAAKDWIGNAARDGRMATVFARLLVDGDDHGVHAVMVPIRDADGEVAAGVRIEDRGAKEGLQGVDNGRIWFDRVRVPRGHLLDRFGHIDTDGRYRSPIPSDGRRFFTMLGTLVAGRISIAAASVSAAKTGLTIALRYAGGRRQFGPEGGEEIPILEYKLLQRELLPRLATTYGLHFAVRDLERAYEEGEAGRGDAPEDSEDGDAESRRRELEVRAAGLKAYASRHCVETLQACREACGGQGYLAANRFGRLKADTDVFTTFEGANPVLLQLVAKGLLSRYAQEMGDLRLWGLVRHLADRAETRLTELNPVVTRKTDEDHLRDPDFHRAALRYREERLLRSVARRLKARLDDGMDSFQAMNECQTHLVALARAHVERLVLDAFQDAVARAPSPGLSEVLAGLAELYALERLDARAGWFLERGYFEPRKSRAIRGLVEEICGEIRECVPFLVDAFGIPDRVLSAPAGISGEG